ncbi:MAG: heme NO-binding domain-containing protein [Actinomycetota bacterium]|nr:heme NO-binding domain-containing protein [Actinomycetota bacterium]
MKGIIFNLLEQVVSDKYGEATWDSLLETTGLEGAYTAVGSYEDEELMKLVGAACEALDSDPDDLVRWFGRTSFPLLAAKYPSFFEGHTTTRTFLLTLNDVIHPEVRKLFPGAYAPAFDFAETAGDSLGLAYYSHRHLCSFAEGLIEGAADHFGESVSIEQPECGKRGDERCLLVTTFNGANA